MSSCTTIDYAVKKPAVFPITCVMAELSPEANGKKFLYTFLDQRNRVYYHSEDRQLELGRKYSYEELVIDREIYNNSLSNK